MKNGITMEKIRDANNTIQSLKPYVIELGKEIGFFNSEWKFSDYSIISKPGVDALFLIAYQNKNIAHTRNTTVPLSYLFDEKGTHKNEYNRTLEEVAELMIAMIRG